MTKTQKTVYILVALVALVMGLTFNKIMSGKGQADNTTLIDAGIILLPQSRQLPDVKSTADKQVTSTIAPASFLRTRWHLYPCAGCSTVRAHR